MTSIDPNKFISALIPIFKSISEIALKKQNNAIKMIKSIDDSAIHESNQISRISVVSQVDKDIQEILLEFIFHNWPVTSVIVEENTPSKSKFSTGQRYYILLDPIDGTKNYLSGNNKFCHIASLMDKREMIASIVYSHSHKSIFSSIAGKGSYVISSNCNSIPVKLKHHHRKNILYHISRTPAKLIADLEQIGYNLFPSSQNATDIINMIDHNIAGFISMDPISYDTWSPAMIISEAGGWLCDWNGNRLIFNKQKRIPNLLVTSDIKITENICKVLQKYV